MSGNTLEVFYTASNVKCTSAVFASRYNIFSIFSFFRLWFSKDCVIFYSIVDGVDVTTGTGFLVCFLVSTFQRRATFNWRACVCVSEMNTLKLLRLFLETFAETKLFFYSFIFLFVFFGAVGEVGAMDLYLIYQLYFLCIHKFSGCIQFVWTVWTLWMLGTANSFDVCMCVCVVCVVYVFTAIRSLIHSVHSNKNERDEHSTRNMNKGNKSNKQTVPTVKRVCIVWH